MVSDRSEDIVKFELPRKDILQDVHGFLNVIEVSASVKYICTVSMVVDSEIVTHE